MIKKILIFLAVVLQSFTANAQEDTLIHKNELKINAVGLLILYGDVTYERLLNTNSSIGISTLINFDNHGYYLKYSITPFYRMFFSKRGIAKDFYFEINAAVFEEQGDFFDEGDEIGYGLGFAIGWKWMSKSNVILDITAGAGRNFNSGNGIELYARFGVSIGKRF